MHLSNLCWFGVFFFSPSCYFVIFSQLWKRDRVAKGKTKQGCFCYPVTLQKCCVPALARGGGRNENQGLRALARRSKISRGGGRGGNVFIPGSLRSPDGFVRSERDADCAHPSQRGQAEPERDLRVPSERLALLVKASPSVSLCQLSSFGNPSQGRLPFASLQAAAFPRLLSQTRRLDPILAGSPKRSSWKEPCTRGHLSQTPIHPGAAHLGEQEHRVRLFHLLVTTCGVLAGDISSARRLRQRLSPRPLLCGAIGGGRPSVSPRLGFVCGVCLASRGFVWVRL